MQMMKQKQIPRPTQIWRKRMIIRMTCLMRAAGYLMNQTTNQVQTTTNKQQTCQKMMQQTRWRIRNERHVFANDQNIKNWTRRISLCCLKDVISQFTLKETICCACLLAHVSTHHIIYIYCIYLHTHMYVTINSIYIYIYMHMSFNIYIYI